MSDDGVPARRVALVYDCLYPYTVGGAERRYHGLVARLARRHRVTYLTRRQWPRRTRPEAPSGVRVVSVSGGRRLYTRTGRRKLSVPLRFGLGVLVHLLRHRRDYDVVHVCSFPYFSLMAARLACSRGGPALVTDWLEVWSDGYWRAYLGPIAGRIGAAIQRVCIRLTPSAFVLSQLSATGLRKAGFRGTIVMLDGSYDGPTDVAEEPARRQPLVVFLGRHIREKRVAAVPAAIAAARSRIPEIRGVIFGDGPERRRVLSEIARLGLADVIDCPGFAPWEQVDAALRRAMCVLLPSEREGYGLVVVEAAARGTPSIVANISENAATELIEDGRNGVLAASAEPEALAAAIIVLHAAGPALTRSTRAWFAENRVRTSLDSALPPIERLYARHPSRAAAEAVRLRSE